MNSSTLLAVIVAIIVVVGGGWWYYASQAPAAVPVAANPSANSSQATSNPGSSDLGLDVKAGTTVSTAPMQATVTYGPNGFSPSTVTIAKGGTVTFVNQSGGNMWVASAPHPTHQDYDGTTKNQHCAAGYTGAAPFDQCTSSNSYSFTFNKTGSWGYHNHSNSNDGGIIIVQ